MCACAIFCVIILFEKPFDESQDGRGIDFCICLGGDGTLLHLNAIFNHQSIPPVVSFAFGSLGFLSPFDFQLIFFVIVLYTTLENYFYLFVSFFGSRNEELKKKKSNFRCFSLALYNCLPWLLPLQLNKKNSDFKDIITTILNGDQKPVKYTEREREKRERGKETRRKGFIRLLLKKKLKKNQNLSRNTPRSFDST